jgi:hypothetical protein
VDVVLIDESSMRCHITPWCGQKVVAFVITDIRENSCKDLHFSLVRNAPNTKNLKKIKFPQETALIRANAHRNAVYC